MRVGVLGINYKSSSLHLREVMAKAAMRRFGHHSKESANLSCVLLSTCNRTEIYFSAEDLASAHSEILQILREEIPVAFEHNVYSYFGSDCFYHLSMVTAGLDSVILAETDIQRQVKMAYENATIDHELSSCIHFLFQKSFKIGKNVRTHFPSSHGLPNLEGTIFYLSQLMFKEVQKASVLLIGNSEINRKILSYLKLKGIEEISLCSRVKHAAKSLADDQDLHLLDWQNLSSWHSFDIVICGSQQSDFLINPEQLSDASFTKNRLIFDLSVPRNADPRLSRHPEITLLNMEEIGQIIEKKRKWRLQELQQAEAAIRFAVDKQHLLFHEKEKRIFACA